MPRERPACSLGARGPESCWEGAERPVVHASLGRDSQPLPGGFSGGRGERSGRFGPGSCPVRGCPSVLVQELRSLAASDAGVCLLGSCRGSGSQGWRASQCTSHVWSWKDRRAGCWPERSLLCTSKDTAPPVSLSLPTPEDE